MADEELKWEKARKKRSYNQFRQVLGIKPGAHITSLDCEKMKVLIMDCVAALGIVQKELVATKRPMLNKDGEPLTKEERDASNKVFVASLSTLATAMILDGTNETKQSNGLVRLLRAFPDYAKQIDGRSWLPLHWANIADPLCVTEEDVKAVYTSDPMALQRYYRIDTRFRGYNPAHLLCMEELTERNMSLIRYFSVCNAQAFTISASDTDKNASPLYCYSALHIACDLGQPTEELLKLLLQLDSSQTKKICTKDGYNPLGYLSRGINFSDSLVACLLCIDSSAEVVGEAIRACIRFSDCSHTLERVELLLKANPEAAKFRTARSSNLLHFAASNRYMPPQVCIGILQQILAINKDALRELCRNGWLPVHYAARYSSVEVMEFLLDAYPESSSIFTNNSCTLMDLAVCDPEGASHDMEAKVKFLCTRYPAMMLHMEDYGRTPLISAIVYGNTPAAQILCEIGGHEQVRIAANHPTNDDFSFNGYLPLHCLISHNGQELSDSILNKYADCFRVLLRLYPEAASFKNGIGEVLDEEGLPRPRLTPYQMAVALTLPVYYRRLLLRAAPDLNPAEYHRLEWAEKRMAMFLAFKAVTSQKKPVVLKRLCAENKDLVKLVISFL